ncbi:MAG: hypothetical protein WC835_02830 [Candidatus Paceibacterota bacterium]|jgi:3D (Asp-Asp-Asp) domain-containing protein
MTSFINIALAGFLVWSGTGGGSYIEAPKNFVPAKANMESVSVRLTGYNALPEQTDNDSEITASGARSNPAVIAARSRDMADMLPYGTVISIEAPKNSISCGFNEVEHLVGYRVIADSMSARKLRQIDLMFDESDVVLVGGKGTNPAVAVGVCKANIRVVGRISLKDIPETQAELALMVDKKLAIK